MESTGLVLEGGGMRGVYTGGVLEFFSEQKLFFPYVIGVSAGACNGASYISRQQGRNRKVTIDLVDHPNYISYKNLLKNKQLFGMDFIFNEIPEQIVPFDHDVFMNAPEKFYIGTTDCDTGETVYFEKNECRKETLGTVLKASSSLPLIAPIVAHDGKRLMDGGISDPIPIQRAIADGNKKNVVVLTRNIGYRKEKQRFTWLLEKAYQKYPYLVERINLRHQQYNLSLDYIEQEEKAGNVFVLRPSLPLKVGRVERDKKRLTELYELGYNDAKRLYHKLTCWLDDV